MARILPHRSWYAVGQPVAIEVRGLGDESGSPSQVSAHRLGRLTGRAAVAGDGWVELAGPRGEPLAVGGHTVELRTGAGALLARTAIEVAPAGPSAVRYGFVTAYESERDLHGVLDWARAMHVTAIQCYDWGYRHADLLGGGEQYADPLGNPVDLATVRRLIAELHAIGASALGYAAVYAVGAQEWPDWIGHALLDATGTAYALGDFLRVVDPAAPAWLAHLGAQLTAAVNEIGFDGFHLDQYGWPKAALRADGTPVDVARSFVTAIEAVRDLLPEAMLIFNNVNDFPTVATSQTALDATYIEVWPPHERLADLAGLALRARGASPGRSVVLAAYPSVFTRAPQEEAHESARLLLATAYSHGATLLMTGEAGRVLTDPYYPRNHEAAPATRELLTRWADFQLGHTDFLVGPDITDVTGSFAGRYNDDVVLTFSGAPTSIAPDPGTVWCRVTRTPAGLVVHIVNLTAVEQPVWDGPQPPPHNAGAGFLRLRRVHASAPRVWTADPDTDGRMQPCRVTVSGTHATAALPPLRTWLMVWIESR